MKSFIVLVLLVLFVSPGDTAPKPRKGNKVVGGARLRSKKSANGKGGKTFNMQIGEGAGISEHLEEMNIPGTQKTKDKKVYASSDRKMTCMEQCTGETSCTAACVKHDDKKTVYVSSLTGNAMELDNSETMKVDTIPTRGDRRRRDVHESNVRDESSNTRMRRALLPSADAGVARVCFHPDSEFMDIFKLFANGNASEALLEAELFIELIVFEMTISYQTLNEYGRTFTLGGTTHTLNLAIHKASIVWPEIVNNEFVNVAWSANSLNGNELSNPADTFRAFVRNTYNAATPCDHYAALTGYGLGGGTIGLAYPRTMCSLYDKTTGYAISVSTLYGLFAILLAHELGHAYGLGGGTIGLAYPRTMCSLYDKTTGYAISVSTLYGLFAILLAHELGHAISPSDVDPSCLYTVKVTDQDYLDSFCQGFRGELLTLDENCKTNYGPDSVSCDTSLTYVTSCSSASGYRCTDGSTCSFILDVPPGTPCTDGVNTGICFKNECKMEFEICGSTTTTAATTPALFVCQRQRCCKNDSPPCSFGNCQLNSQGNKCAYTGA